MLFWVGRIVSLANQVVSLFPFQAFPDAHSQGIVGPFFRPANKTAVFPLSTYSSANAKARNRAYFDDMPLYFLIFSSFTMLHFDNIDGEKYSVMLVVLITCKTSYRLALMLLTQSH